MFMQPFRRDQIRTEIERLKGPVLTIYLNTNPRNEEWKIRLKNGLKRTQEYYEKSNPNEAKTLSKIITNVTIKIRDEQQKLAKSFVCFASSDEVLFYPFQFPVENDFIWENNPSVEQLEQLFEKFIRTGVILLQSDRITLLTATLGELVDQIDYEIDIDKDNWRRYKGLAFGSVISSSANHRHKFERRIKENQARWYKNIVPTIEKHAEQLGWKSIHLIGPSELTKNMRQQLNKKVDSEINRNYGSKSANEILARTIYADDETSVN